jgi:hypothetical protein
MKRRSAPLINTVSLAVKIVVVLVSICAACQTVRLSDTCALHVMS